MFRGMPGGLLQRQRECVITNHLDDKHKALALRFIGGADRRTIEDFFQPGSYAPQERLNRNGRRTLRRGSGAGRASIFREHLWEQITVVPFETAPGTICAFALIDDDQGKRSPDFAAALAVDAFFSTRSAPDTYGGWATGQSIIFRSLGDPKHRLAEAGLAMFTAACAGTHQQFPDDLFVFFDLVLALDTQLRFLQSCRHPLPIVVARDDPRFRTMAAWQNVPPERQRIIISDAYEPHLFRQAQLANARVFIKNDLVKFVRQSYHPARILHRARQNARHWPNVLELHLKNLSPDKAAEFLLQIDLPAEARANFFKRCKPDLLKHLRRGSHPALFDPCVCVEGELIFQHADGWHLDQASTKISDPVVVQQILCQQDGTRWLQGAIQAADQSQSFLVREDSAVKLGLPAVLLEYFREHGFQPYCHHGWAHRILGIALAFHLPKTVTGADVVGWDGSAFRFPQFGINLGRRGLNPERRTQFVFDDTPAKNLLPPTDLVDTEMRRLTLDCLEVNRFWAIIVTMAYMALAPAIRRRPIGVILAGGQAPEVAATIAGVFGCLQRRTPPKIHAARAYEELNTILTGARWPIVVHPGVKHLRALGQMFKRLAPANCFVPISETRAALAAREQDWFVLSCDNALATVKLLEEFGANVLVTYLCNLLARHLDHKFHCDDALNNLLRDVAKWFGDNFRGRPAILGAERTLWPPTQGREWFLFTPPMEDPIDCEEKCKTPGSLSFVTEAMAL